MYIIISMEKLGEFVKEINDGCSGGPSRPKGELIMELMTMIRVQKDRINMYCRSKTLWSTVYTTYQEIQ